MTWPARLDVAVSDRDMVVRLDNNPTGWARTGCLGALLRLPRCQSPGASQRQLQFLAARRSALVQMRCAERNRLGPADTAVRASIQAVHQVLTDQIRLLEQRIQILLAGITCLADKAWRLQPIPDIATAGAAILVGTIPELGRLDRKAIVTLMAVQHGRAGKRAINISRPTANHPRSLWWPACAPC